MPLIKRALTEADVNARSAPKSKRYRAASKENSVPAEKAIHETRAGERSVGGDKCVYDVHGNADNLDDTVDTVSTSNAQSKAMEPKMLTPMQLADIIARLNEVPDGDEAKREKMNDVDDNTWMCFCRSRADKQRQHPELWLNQIKAHPGTIANCMCGRYADRNPEHNWIVTWKSTDILADAIDQVGCRDQDDWGIYIFNRWNAYAISEVVENMVCISTTMNVQR